MPIASPVPQAEPFLLVFSEVDASNLNKNVIAKRSWKIARRFSSFYPGLENHGFSASLLGRMCSGQRLKSLRYEKLLVVKLTLESFGDPAHREWADEKCRDVLRVAKEFAERVREAARRASSLRGTDPVHPLSAVQEHAIELLGDYGKELLGQLKAGDTPGRPEAKLALLHRLHGNTDDERYWKGQAIAFDGQYSHPESLQEAFAASGKYAEEYCNKSRFDVASIYLRLAAESGDTASARRLGSLADFLGRDEEADRWYRMAECLRPSKGGLSADIPQPEKPAVQGNPVSHAQDLPLHAEGGYLGAAASWTTARGRSRLPASRVLTGWPASVGHDSSTSAVSAGGVQRVELTLDAGQGPDPRTREPG
ncbi:hypothetical protein [Nonomuraea typhae]|uniref:Sel1 repeat family protein n=1 Tax=Nonomuraea typhae TaxID=2603600 RepID=A0ABW7Z2T9_9ACTN